jgi:hypothetical protein
VVIQIVAEEVIPDVEINRRANRHHPGAIRVTGAKNALVKKQKKQKKFLFLLFFPKGCSGSSKYYYGIDFYKIFSHILFI